MTTRLPLLHITPADQNGDALASGEWNGSLFVTCQTRHRTVLVAIT